MISSNLEPVVKVKTANRALLALLLLPVLGFPFASLPNGMGVLILALVNLIGIALLFHQPLREFVRDERFRTLPSWTSAIVITGLSLAICFGLTLFVYNLLYWFSPNLVAILEKKEEDLLSVGGVSGIFGYSIVLFAGAVIVPLYEEFLFRGIGLRAYERARSPIFASFFTAVLFALVHGSVIRIFTFIPDSFLVARAVQRKRCWWLAVIVHMTNNAIAFSMELFNWDNTETKRDASLLLTALAAGAIAAIAFFIASRWLKVFASDTELIPEKPEKIVTPALTVVLVLAFIALAAELNSLIFPK